MNNISQILNVVAMLFVPFVYPKGVVYEIGHWTLKEGYEDVHEYETALSMIGFRGDNPVYGRIVYAPKLWYRLCRLSLFFLWAILGIFCQLIFFLNKKSYWHCYYQKQ